jgi:hypothetical protein
LGLQLAVHKYLVERDPEDRVGAGHLDEMISVTAEITGIVEGIARDGSLGYLQDLACATLSTTCLHLFQVSRAGNKLFAIAIAIAIAVV